MQVLFGVLVSLICAFIVFAFVRDVIKTRREIIEEKEDFERFLEQTHKEGGEKKCCGSCKCKGG